MEATHERFKQGLITAFEEILDKMVFMVFEPGTKSDLPPAEFAYTSQISFGGRLSGTMRVFLTRATAEEFARNLIGIRQGDTLHNATLEDALREFCNILMGRTLSLMAPEEHFDLQLPVTHPGTVRSAADPISLAVDGVLNEVEPCRIEVSLSPSAR
jgi:chemotaxis protein CheY-P-specific phosphatase CheC